MPINIWKVNKVIWDIWPDMHSWLLWWWGSLWQEVYHEEEILITIKKNMLTIWDEHNDMMMNGFDLIPLRYKVKMMTDWSLIFYCIGCTHSTLTFWDRCDKILYDDQLEKDVWFFDFRWDKKERKRNSAVFVCIPNWHVFWNSNFKNVVQSIIPLMFDVAVLFCHFSIHFCWHFTSSKVEKICKDKKKENTSRVRQKSHFFSSSLCTLPVLFYKYL